ncbi:MAG: Gfo/Idh/MocA family oxidoreductase [Candidatus Omnitrophica bacterium]|nr:Gfo/Idh/MocA family oxidoreductase [Candidatus Omnitrophota bacterium]MCM8768702.1 Gfo/Idh/MocA family oxidoreductase [Candidatus Omnitrophota bacterium]
MARVRVGIIGCGKFAQAQHLPNCARAANVELYCCSSRSESGRKAAEEYGASKITSDYRELLRDPSVDLVILSVPHQLHQFFIQETIQAGKHLLCEKPMTMTLAEAYQVIKSVRKKGVKLCVDYNRRFSPAMVDLKEAFFKNRRQPSGPPRVYVQEKDRRRWPEEDQAVIVIRINDESLTYGGVHIDWQEGGGQIIGEGCHWLDLMPWLIEEQPVELVASGSTRLNYIINLKFSSGSLGCLIFSANGTFEYPKELIEIQDHGKIFRSECFVENQYFGCGQREIKKFPLQTDYYPEIGKEGGLSGYLKKIDAMGREFQETGQFRYVFPDKGHFQLLTAFADAIISNQPSPVDEIAGMRATYLSLRAMDSIRLDKPLPINIEDWDMYIHQ